MVRLSDLPEYEREHLLSKNQPPLGPLQWSQPNKALDAMRFALITTAGLHYRDEDPFKFADASFRPIAGDDTHDLVTSHSSANFDRSGLAEDLNLVFPIDRFRELVSNRTIGSLAEVHFSFMGAGLEPEAYEASAAQVAGFLQQDRVDAVFLTPV